MKDLEKRILNHLEERGWDHLRPSDLAKVEGIKKELADVLIYALEMSVLLGLDTTEIINKKLDHAARKYPAELMKKNAKKGAGSGEDSAYWRIKEEYRRK